MNDVILENLIRKYRNKNQFKTLALAIFNNLNEDERQKLNSEISALKIENNKLIENFKLE